MPCEDEATFRAGFQELASKYESLGPLPEGFDEILSSVVGQRRRADTEAAIEAATLVFAHAIIERLLHDVLDVLALVRPDEITARLPERKVSLADVRSKPLAGLVSEVAQNHVRALRMETLEKKVKWILTLCDFDASCQKDGYHFDQERLLTIDKRRQELLHGHLLSGPISPASSELAFIHGTGLFLLCTVARHLNSPINLWGAFSSAFPVDLLESVTSILKAPGSA